MGAGNHINSTEDRAVMHMALRSPASKSFLVDGVDVVPDVHAVLNKISSFSEEVRNSRWVGSTGRPIKNIISVGIGGSYLGPEFVYEALRTDPTGRTTSAGRTLRFLANVDPVDVARATQSLNPEETLVVIVSKTFTTAETMLNAKTLREWLLKGIPGTASSEVISKHMVAVRSVYCCSHLNLPHFLLV
jgi:glucose-6-phosphate isomerase